MRVSRWLWLILGVLWMAAAAPAAALTVSPIVIDLTPFGRGGAATVTVNNGLPDTVTLELSVVEAELTTDGLRPTERSSDDLLAFPATAIIEPGKTQAFRIQWVGEPKLERSRHYFVKIAQLPVKLPDQGSVLQVLYAFNVAVSVAASVGESNISVTGVRTIARADGQPIPVVAFKNDGATYGYVSGGKLRIEKKDASGKSLLRKIYSGQEILDQIGLGLVGAGANRELTIPLPLPEADGVLEAEFTPPGR